MYIPGKIIFFDPFYFKNGNLSKPKYFLVLKVIAKNVVLVTLPTSVDYMPRNITTEHGCVEIPEGCINCYIFKANVSITECGWSFQKDTFLYGKWIDEYEIDMLLGNYPLEGIDFEIVGDLTKVELANVIDCFSKSSVVKNKFKRLLSS